MSAVGDGRITVFLADDNVIVREGVRALLGLEADLEVVGTADDYDSLLAGAEAAAPQVLVTDIRMPPNFQQEGISAAKQLRKRHPGTGVVVLSQYDDPDYAISLLGDGAAGYAYLLKDRVAEGDQLARAVREVATGGSVLDPKIVEALVQPVTGDSGLTAADEELLHEIAEGRPIKAIAASRGTTSAAVASAVEELFLKLSEGASAGTDGALKRLRLLHQAIVDREEQGEQLSRLLPGGLAELLRGEGRRIGETEELVVTVLMGDIRGYSAIAECTDPSQLAVQLSEHRAAMNAAILAEQGTVMQFVGDAVMACFGAPLPLEAHADHALNAARSMIEKQRALNTKWDTDGRPPFGIGIGLSTGQVAAALLGSEERVEYTLVGDTVNLAQRLQDLARPAGRVVLNATTYSALQSAPSCVDLGETIVKGRNAAVHAYRCDVEEMTDGNWTDG
ncbi:MAG TPA: adenylate/guanylate cyclase domain-containing protein [Acidimicrobiia bacterium]|nr:adenylate/guanylate cyclase domain-containing protein [Acidimicrobiia bacterium]